MQTVQDRLAYLRSREHYRSMRAAAAAYGIGYDSYKKIATRDGSDPRPLTPDVTMIIARHHRISPGWLQFGEGTPDGSFSVPIEGRIGAGQEMMVYETTDNRVVSGLIGSVDARAFEVEGTSMMPLARARDIVFVGAAQTDISDLIGCECAVLLQDGRRFFKVIENGSKPGRHDLISYNAETIRDVEIHSAGRFLGLRRAGWLRRAR